MIKIPFDLWEEKK